MQTTPTLAPPALSSQNKAIRQLGVTRDMVRRWMEDGTLTTVTIPPGNRVKILQASIDAKYAELYGGVKEAM